MYSYSTRTGFTLLKQPYIWVQNIGMLKMVIHGPASFIYNICRFPENVNQSSNMGDALLY